MHGSASWYGLVYTCTGNLFEYVVFHLLTPGICSHRVQKDTPSTPQKISTKVSTIT